MSIQIRANAYGGWGSWFTITGTDAHLADWLTRRGTQLVIDEDAVANLDAPLTHATLWPTCEHGLSQRLCYGEGHYPTYGVNTIDETWR